MMTRPFTRASPITRAVSAGAALAALQAARAGETVFSLMRPPGHHATPQRAMGFCYLNNIAIAVLEALATGAKRVAVYDFDVHHGNGTEAILLNQARRALFSPFTNIPAIPAPARETWASTASIIPCRPQTPRADYRHVLHSALEQLQQVQARPGSGLRRVRLLRARPAGAGDAWRRRISTGWASPSASWACRSSACWRAATARTCRS